jgi:tetracycline 7-halogenase / FADH2 O2-dependent halogenase
MTMDQTTMKRRPAYDVLILGSGIAGTILGAILARHGRSVAMIDAGTHPRMAIGESTIPYTSALLRLLADRYDLPELRNLTSFTLMDRCVSASNGVKSNFGFVYHREGEPVRPEETNQLAIPKLLDIEHHLFRQDVDAYMLAVAVRRGADIFQNVRVTDVATDDTGVTLDSSAGAFRGRYLVDASGYASPVVEKYGLRETPCSLMHQSRGLFTHMIDVKPYDSCVEPNRRAGAPRPWHQGTLHHIFDGGWMWVIPFDNHARARNPLVSVGFLLDPRRYPRQTGNPEREFRAIVNRFPDMRHQFENAKAVRPWVSSGRIQYSSTRMVLDRICLTAHAAGFVDALYSQGLAITMMTINTLAHRLLAACEDGDFSARRFQPVEDVALAMVRRHDRVVYSAFTGFRDFRLWNVAVRVWALGAFLATFHAQNTLRAFQKTGDQAAFDALEAGPYYGTPTPGQSAYDDLLNALVADCEQVERGALGIEAAATRTFERLAHSDIVPPAFGLADPAIRFFHPTPPKMLKTLLWSKTRANPEIGAMVRQALRGFAQRRLLGVG